MNGPLRLGVFLLSSVLWVPVAVADIALHDGGVERDGEVSDLVTEHAGAKPRMVLSGDVLAGPTRLLASNAEVEQCEGAPIQLGLGVKLDGVIESVLSFQLEQAIESLDVLETLLPCSDAPVPATKLAKVSFLRGAAMLDMGDEAGARVAMADALAQDPSFQGLKGFPKNHTDLLASLAVETQAVEPSLLFGWNKQGAVDEVLLNGAPVADPSRAGGLVRAGRHLVQLKQADGSLRGMWVRTSGIDAVVIHPGAGRRVWADGGRSPGGAMAMRLILLSEFQGRDGDIHVLRFKGRRVVSALTYPEDGGVASDWNENRKAGGKSSTSKDPSPVARKNNKPARKPRTETAAAESRPEVNRADSIKPYRLRFAIGGGYQYVHPFSYGMLSADLNVRVVGPLTVTVFARPSFGGQFTVDLGENEPVDGAIILVPFGAGVGLQKHDGTIGPFVFASFHAAPNRVIPLGSLMVGATIQGGVDFAPNDGPFIVRVEGEAGFLGANDDSTGSFFAGFAGRFGVSAGARF